MRPHRLRLSAFGPFADTVEVDLDALADAGLFLLHGSTGAGKTTLLDGIGFALYGRVPGARNSAKRLRSDHSSDAVRTEVALEVSFGARRVRITRSPEQERAKRRGSGTTTEPAKVLLEERRDDAWAVLSTRAGEADQEIADLVGMSADQFFQVVLLPQGEFAQFLRAKSEDRAKVLQRLFATERFADVEQWLAARRRATAEAAAAARDEVAHLLHRISEVAAVDVPGDAGTAVGLLTAAQAAEAVAAESVSALTTVRDAARAALDSATSLADGQRRRQRALAVVDDLDARRPALLTLQQEADLAARAAEVQSVLRDVTVRRTARDGALSGEAVARAELAGAGLAPDLAAPELSATAAAARERTGNLEALRAVATAQHREQAAVATARDEHAVALTEVAALEVSLAALPVDRERAAARARAGRAAAERAPAVTAERDRLVALRPDVVALVEVETSLLRRREEHLAARQTHVALLEKANDLRTASINSMVSKLAFALEDETPCPVCGSLAHPDPSSLRDEGVSSDDEEAARRAADEAQQAVSDLEALLAADRARAEALRARVDDLTPAGVDAQVAELDLELGVLAAETRDGSAAEAALDELDALRTRLTGDHVAATARVAAAVRRSEEASGRADAAAAQLSAVLGDHADLDAALAAAGSEAAAAEHALQAGTALGVAQQELDRALAAAEEACRERGFADSEQARAAARDDAWRDEAVLTLREAADARAAVTAELADPALDVPLEPAAPVDAAAATLRGADDDLAAATGGLAGVRGRREGLERLVPLLEGAQERLTPLEDEASRVRRLADLCAGQGANGLKMTLSAFVLAARLEEVAAAASVRLLRMTQGRYELVHTDGSRGNAKAGLGLLARDGWSGHDRDTATLSGGETFLASLALALGLADVVTAEAGGSRIEALFVDEGFGTLDDQALDEVMDVLDGLREGGRVVGVVSHVAELRQRIPAQVEVRRTRSGSDVVVHGT